MSGWSKRKKYSPKLVILGITHDLTPFQLFNFHLGPVLWIEISESKAQVKEFPPKVDVPQQLDKWHMDKKFKPAGLSRCGELIEELSNVNQKRGEHPTNGEYGPLGVVMVWITVIQGQIYQKGINISSYVQRRKH